jgi:hypothetical protein
MFERISDAAERVATNVSRRAFLGRLGQGALGLAAILGGVLAFPAQAEAGNSCCVVSAGLACLYYKNRGNCACGGVKVDCNKASPTCRPTIC